MFIADIVGQPGRRAVKELLPGLRQRHGVDVVVANGENAERKHTERRLNDAQAQLRQYAVQLEDRVQERTTHLRNTVHSLEGVCYHIAHDLRAPLRAMEGFTNILSQNLSTSLDQISRTYLANISAAAERMDLLINGLLEYGRLGHEHYPLEPVRSMQVLENVLQELEPQIATTRSHIDLPDSCPEVLANPRLLFIVFLNLLSNSLKFIAAGVLPKIAVRCESIPFEGNSNIRFWIEDNGIGIPAERRHKAFWIFERLHPAQPFPGIGMGLALASKAMDRMHGRMGVEPGPAGGSRFWFELPVSVSKPQEKHSVPSLVAPLQGASLAH